MKLTGHGRRAHMKLGAAGERIATLLYLRRGYGILARNWRCSYGELDIVARDGGVLVFAEVKTLRRESIYTPRDNLSRKQLRRDLRAAAAFREKFASDKTPWRFELVEVVIRNRFSVKIRRTRLSLA